MQKCILKSSFQNFLKTNWAQCLGNCVYEQVSLIYIHIMKQQIVWMEVTTYYTEYFHTLKMQSEF